VDNSVKGMLRFGDGSLVEIVGRGSVMFTCKDGEHRVLSDVYLIPWLRTSIFSLGQLDEIAYKTVIENWAMCVYDQRRVLLAKAPCMCNRLYSVVLQKAMPVCLLSKAGDMAPEESLHRRSLCTGCTSGVQEVRLWSDERHNICGGSFSNATSYFNEINPHTYSSGDLVLHFL
jgi:hypothetical protein